MDNIKSKWYEENQKINKKILINYPENGYEINITLIRKQDL